ncbi:MAG TPA: lantibiotic dehydratase [Candidatus Polarisedimenticolia bacterium]|nr:lantibiotic dehydratase [Candidatus Polarisedimenticolia bacterium]
MSRTALLRIASLPFDSLAALHGGPLLQDLEALLGAESMLSGEARSLADFLHAAAGESTDDPERAKGRFAVLRLRRDAHNGRRLRGGDMEQGRALLGAGARDRLARYEMWLERRDKARETYEASFGEALGRGRLELLRITSDPLVEHGIYLASGSLLPKLRRLAQADPSRLSHDERHTAAKLAAYVTRMAAKTSPNGLFCSVALARFEGRSTSIEGLPGISHVDVLLSLAEARKVSACLAADPAVEPAILPRPNPTLREKDGSWTFWKPASPRNPTDEEILSRVKDQPVLRLFLEEARGGIHTPAGLLRAVAARGGRDSEELRPFYRTLVERGILIAEIEIPYSSRRRLRELAASARQAGAHAGWIERVERIEDAVDEIPRLAWVARREAMERIVKEVGALPRNRPFKADELFRVDSASSLAIRLPERIIEDLRGPLRVFVRLLAGNYPEALQHRSLVSRFLKNHPADTDVEFLELYGGFAEKDEPLVRPAEFSGPGTEASVGEGESETLSAKRRTWEWFVRMAEESAPGATVELSEATLRSLVGDFPEPRWATGVLFQIAARSPGDLDEGRYELALNGLFNGIGLALARFAHLLGGGRAGADNPVVAELRRAWSTMERPGTLLAELTFNHEARTANAGLRPVLFTHEIELPGDKTSPGVQAIPLTDLVIRYDTAADRLVLRSVSRGVEVIPVLSSGVSPSGIVSELVHLGRQGWQTVGYVPGFHAPQVSRWPRYVCGKLVLFRARWTFRAGEVPPLARGKVLLSDAEFFFETAGWRARHGLPRHVFAHTAAEPKPFYVDLESPLSVDLLRRALASVPGGSEVVLFVTEMLPGPDHLWVRDERGGYATEFLIQLEGGSSSA